MGKAGAEAVAALVAHEEEESEDVEGYTCPIGFCLMENPVRTPLVGLQLQSQFFDVSHNLTLTLILNNIH